MLKKIFFTLIALTTLFTWQSNAQETTTIFLGGGINTFDSNVSESEFLNSDRGFNGGLFIPFLKKNKFNIGLNLSGAYNFTTNDFSNLGKIIPIQPQSDLTTETFSNNVNQSLLQLGIGPQFNFKLGNRFWLSPILQAGYFDFNQDEIQVTQDNTIRNNTFSTEIFTQNKVNESGLFLKPALHFSYQITNKLSIWAEGNYFLASVNTVNNTLIPLGEPNEQGEYNWGQLAEGAAGDPNFLVTENETSLNNLGASLGLAYSFGKKEKKKEIEKKKEQQYISFPVRLTKPSDQRDFYLSEKDRPIYEWEEQSIDKPDYYVFILLDNQNEVIYSEKTKKTSLQHNRKLENIYKSKTGDDATTLHWEVESHFTKGKTLRSKSKSLVINKRSTGLTLDFLEVECKRPAYDNDGNVYFTAKVCVKNPSSNNTNLVIPSQTFTVTDVANSNSTNATQITGSNNPVFPITLLPNDEICFNIEFSRPIGEQESAFHLNYYEQGYPNLSTEEIARANIPSCICNICDDWRIIATKKKFFEYSALESNMRIMTNFQILNASPIQQVKAEIISVEHSVNDEQCYTCTTKDEQMGLFHGHQGSGRIWSNTGWQNNGQGFNSDNSNDNYFNEFTWNAESTQGVDFSTEKRIDMRLSLPEISSLECCEGIYTVCIRYTFTDINCQSCDIVICYKYDSSEDTGGNTGGGGVGVGDDHININNK